MDKIIRIESKTMVLPLEDVDTDQIIPARFLTATTREGIGKALFADWRYDADGEPIADFVLNRPETAGCEVMVVGRNFGCGSSREHAPWGLVEFGVRAVVSTEIADIFRNNALKNGLVPVIVDAKTHQFLLDNPGIMVAVDVKECTLSLPDGRSVEFPIDGFSRHCIMNGIDQLEFLQQQETAIADFEAHRPWKP